MKKFIIVGIILSSFSAFSAEDIKIQRLGSIDFSKKVYVIKKDDKGQPVVKTQRLDEVDFNEKVLTTQELGTIDFSSDIAIP